MNRLELRDLVKVRVGWKADPNYTIDANNQTSDGGRYFQDEHSFVKIETIRALMETANPTEQQLNDYLSDLKDQVSLSVVDDVMSDYDFNDLTGKENLFDAAYAKRMAIKLGELIWTTARSNRRELIAKEYAQQVFFDVNGDPNFPDKVSIMGAYRKEVERLRDIFNTDNALDVNTIGTVTFWDDDRIKFL
ncbi:hypothetical protein [Christiangramia crocea]|uniref:Uncharacterized protein n=1 Tax=Christiangramia crocea TaxID=2904124 RepID=A0A9X2A6H0_9FLAO|nr:hypothetical protein [Gramella crocea]MCG9970996.1 hypothetical protein [Gramella crocea]